MLCILLFILYLVKLHFNGAVFAHKWRYTRLVVTLRTYTCFIT